MHHSVITCQAAHVCLTCTSSEVRRQFMSEVCSSGLGCAWGLRERHLGSCAGGEVLAIQLLQRGVPRQVQALRSLPQSAARLQPRCLQRFCHPFNACRQEPTHSSQACCLASSAKVPSPSRLLPGSHASRARCLQLTAASGVHRRRSIRASSHGCDAPGVI